MQNGMPPPTIGAVTASATFFRQIGGTIGIAGLMTVFLTRMASGFAALGTMHPADRELGAMVVVSDATRAAFQAGVLVVALAFVLTLRLPEIELRRR
jgi:hypothetical protein